MKRTRWMISMVAVLLIAMATAPSAEVPLLINYRGYVDVSDPIIGLSTGALTADLTFSLYDTIQIAGVTPLWAETQTVQLLDGNFAVILGSVSPLSLDLFASSQRYLSVNIGAIEVISPQLILSVPYAMQAGNVYSADDGRVGIGTTNPQAALDVQGSIKASMDVTASGALSAGGTITSNGLVQSNSGGFKFPDGTTQITRAIGDGYSLDAADGEPANAVYVDATGWVGIGTTSPQSHLHISATGSAELLIEADSDDDLIGDASDHPALRFSQDGGRVQARIGFLQGEDNVLGVMNEYPSVHADLVLGTSDTERMRITADGRIGIGTDIPSAELAVRGNIVLGASGELHVPGSIENLRIVRGNVNANGTKAQGEGFTVGKYNTGRYTIVFEPEFGDTPSITVTTGDLAADDDNVANIRYLTKEQVNIYICDVTDGYNSAEDSWFSFIAIGPR